MTRDDEEFARSLRARVDQAAPQIDVRTDSVVPAARRRRARNAVATSVAGVLVVAIVGVWAVEARPWAAPEVLPAERSMGVDGHVTSPDAADMEPRAVVDPDTGTITTPLDSWSWGARDYAISRTAVDHFVVGCLQDAGYEATFDGPYPAEPDRDSEYGLWRMEDAIANGYASLMAPDLDDVGAEWDTDQVPSKASRDCYGAAADEGLTFDLSGLGEGPTGVTSVMYTKEGQRIRDEWRTCLAEHGESAPSSDEAGMVPDRVLGASTAEQIRIAKVDIGCKDELGTVQRLADVGAREEAVYIARGRQYLAERHVVEEEARATATAYLDDVGVTMPWDDR